MQCLLLAPQRWLTRAAERDGASSGPRRSLFSGRLPEGTTPPQPKAKRWQQPLSRALQGRRTEETHDQSQAREELGEK